MQLSSTLKRVIAITVVIALTLGTNAAIGYAAKTGMWLDSTTEMQALKSAGTNTMPTDSPRPSKSAGTNTMPTDSPRPGSLD
jgi:hypothetical protein